MKNMETTARLKVMHVLKSSVYSGAENVVITIMQQLKDSFEFLYVATDGPVRSILEEREVPFQLVDRFDRGHLKKIAGSFRPDIIHAHDFSATVLCAALPGRFRLISHLHYDPPWAKKWNLKTILYLMCCGKIEKVITVSGKMFDSMVFSDAFRKKQITAGNPIDGARIRRLAEMPVQPSDQKLNQAEQEAHCDIIFVGRFVEQKNPQRFIYLIDKLRRAGWSDVCAWMLGQGELMDSCRKLIQSLQLEQNIILKGFQENPYSYICRAKMMCITSGWEGFGLVAAEASILGIPVLSTDNSGCSEILGDESPELCRTDEEFVEKMMMLHNDSESYRSWKERSLERAVRFDNMERYMQEISRVYRNED